LKCVLNVGYTKEYEGRYQAIPHGHGVRRREMHMESFAM
jgi:hypothetical protein